MKDYFRRERISFKYTPILWAVRLLFVSLVIFSGSAQWIIMLLGSAVSVGYVHSTEMEHMLPLSDKEITAKNLRKIRFVWLRYLILGVMSKVYVYLAVKNGWIVANSLIANETPLIDICFFILLMVYAYELMLDAGNDNKRLDGLGSIFKKKAIKYFIETLPHIVFFIYAISMMMSGSSRRGILSKGSDRFHIYILITAAVLLTVDVILERRKSRLCDYYPYEV